MMLRIRIDDKTFPAALAAPARTVFRDFALDLPEGQFCLVAGPSGIGKSTLLSIVAGLDAEFDGSVAGMPRPLGFVFQTPRLLPWATARANVALAIPGREDEARHWLGAVGLAASAEIFPERLSLGMARRVALARALAVGPALLLLDEPFASLDGETAEGICALLRREACNRRTTVLLVTHDLTRASGLAERVVVLDGSPARIARDVTLGRFGPSLAAGEAIAGRARR